MIQSFNEERYKKKEKMPEQIKTEQQALPYRRNADKISPNPPQDWDSGYSLMKPVGQSLDDLHIHNDHSDDTGMSDEEDTCESAESEDDDGEEQEDIHHPILFSDELKGSAFACSTSSPLVSAIKGSREKQGCTPRELRVTWAPDVYEPAPTKLQDIVTRGTKQWKVPKKGKTIGKEGQKGEESLRGGGRKESTQAGGGKDKKKKQNHRRNARGSKSFGYPDFDDADDYEER